MARVIGALKKKQPHSCDPALRGVEKKKREEAMTPEEKIAEKVKKAEEVAKSREEVLQQMREMLASKDLESNKQLGTIGCLDEGRFEWREHTDAVGQSFVFSSYASIHGVRFRLGVRLEEDSGGRRRPVLYLFCNDDVAAEAPSATIIWHVDLFEDNHDYSLWKGAYRTLFGPSTEHSEGQMLPSTYGASFPFKVEAHILLISLEKDGPAPSPPPAPRPTDVTLLVDGEAFDVRKEYLAYYAKYFKVIFSSNFAEKEEKQITLQDIDVRNFKNLLNVIATRCRKKRVDRGNVVALLQMADFFDMPFVSQMCSDFLIKSIGPTRAGKLLLSEQFRLPELQYHMGQSLKTFNDFKMLIQSAEFPQLSDGLQALLLQKCLANHG